jgi:dolichol-phosphate mannosyltransferase
VDNTLIIVPTYNEIESLDSMVGRIRQSVPLADVLIVDDLSPDGTGERADALAAADPAIHVLHHGAKDGLGRAYLAGFAYAVEHDYELVCQIDADGSHDPASLPAMITLATDGAALVIGSRWVPGGSVKNWPWIRRAISRSGNSFARASLQSHIRDITAGFRVFRTETLRGIDLASITSQGYCFQIETAWRTERSGLLVVEYPIIFIERATGRSKMHLGIVLEAFWRVTYWGLTRSRAPQ